MGVPSELIGVALKEPILIGGMSVGGGMLVGGGILVRGIIGGGISAGGGIFRGILVGGRILFGGRGVLSRGGGTTESTGVLGSTLVTDGEIPFGVTSVAEGIVVVVPSLVVGADASFGAALRGVCMAALKRNSELESIEFLLCIRALSNEGLATGSGEIGLACPVALEIKLEDVESVDGGALIVGTSGF